MASDWQIADHVTRILTSDWLQGGGDLGPGLPQTQPCGGQGQSAGARD